MFLEDQDYLKKVIKAIDDGKITHASHSRDEGLDLKRLKVILSGGIILIPIEMLMFKTSRSRSWVYSVLNEESPAYDKFFPKPVPVGTRSKSWVLSEVESWLQSRLDARGVTQ